MSTSSPLLLTPSDIFANKWANSLEDTVTSKGLHLAVNLTSVTPAAKWSHLLQGKIAGSEREDKWWSLCPSLNRMMIPAHFLQDEGRLRGGYWQPVRRPDCELGCSGVAVAPLLGQEVLLSEFLPVLWIKGSSLALSMRAKLASKRKAN